MAPPDLLMIFAIQWLILVDTDAQQLRVQPSLLVQAIGLEAVFYCPYNGTDLRSYAWTLNGLFINPSNQPSGVSLGPGSSSVNILAIPQYNNTIVQCTAVQYSGSVVSENATLVVHETKLETMASQYDITVSWNNPFTTDLSFCVGTKLVGSSETVVSECVSGTRYVFTSLDSDLCEDLSFTVTPTVTVEGIQMNGTSSKPVVGYFRGRRAIGVVHCQQSTCQVTFSTPLTPGCECDLLFTSIDSEELPSISYSQTVRGNGNTVYRLDPTISHNRLYSVDVAIEVFNDTHELPNQNITTHDIVNASANQCNSEGGLNISCTFVQNTTASGYLATISNANRSEDTIFLVEYNTAGTDDLTDGVGPGDYSIAFYDLESDGLPAHSSDANLIGGARTAKVTITDGTRNQSLLESKNPLTEVGVEVSGDEVEMFCSSVMDCLVLTYDCSNSEILYSLYIYSNNTKVMKIAANRPYSIAFFGVNNNTGSFDRPLERHPGKVMNDVIAHSEESSAATTIPVMADLSSLAPDPMSEEFNVTGIEHNGSSFIVIASSASTVIFVLLLVLCGIIGAVIFWHKIKRKQSPKLFAIKAEKSFNPSSVEPVEEFQKQNSRECKGLEERSPGFNDYDEVSYTAVVDTWEVTVDNVAYQHLEVAQLQPVYAQVAPQQALPNQVGDKFISVDYAVLDHDKLVTTLKESVKLEKKETTPALPPKPTPLNMDTLHALLTPAASKWYEIGLAMGLNEDTLDDEVHPGNSTDWLRLKKICGLYCESKHSWEEVVHLLWEIEEWEIADRICSQERLLAATQGVHPPPSLPPKPADKTFKD